MKASFIPQHGGPEVFQFGDVLEKALRPNEVRVQLNFAALNHVDVWVRMGGPVYPVSLPHVMGSDGAGIIQEVGTEVEGVIKGDRVAILPALSCGSCPNCLGGWDNQCDQFEILGTKTWGTYGESVVVPDDNVLIIPDSLRFEEAAAFPLAYLTAWHMLVGRAHLNKGETILIVGASSGVSVAGIQIAKLKGANVLAVTTKSDKAKRIRSIGADEVFVVDEKSSFSAWAIKNTGGKGVDVVMEHVGPATWAESVKSLAKYGRLVTCGATTGPMTSLELRAIFSRDLTILGARMGTKKEFQELASQVCGGRIQPVIDRIFPLSEATQAHQHLEARQQIGKVLLQIC